MPAGAPHEHLAPTFRPPCANAGRLAGAHRASSLCDPDDHGRHCGGPGAAAVPEPAAAECAHRHRQLERSLRFVGLYGQEGRRRAQCSRSPSSCASAAMSPRCASSPPIRRSRSFAATPDSARRSMRSTDNPLPDTLIVTPTLHREHAAGHRHPEGGDRRHERCANRADRHRMGEAAARHAGSVAAGGAAHRRPLGRRDRAHRQQHHSPRYIEPARRNRGHETGGRVATALPAGPFSTAASGTAWAADCWPCCWSPSPRRCWRGRSRSWPFCTAASFSLQGLEHQHRLGGSRAWPWAWPGWAPGLLQRAISEAIEPA